MIEKLLGPLSLLSAAFGKILSAPLYLLMRYVVRYRREVVDRNLAICFSNLSDKERKRIEQGFYRHLSGCLLETIRMQHIRPVELEKMVEIDASQFQPFSSIAFIYMAHLGNWEMIHAALGYAVSNGRNYLVYARQHNKHIDEYIYKIRSRFNMTLVESHEVSKLLEELTARGEKANIFALCDQLPPDRYVRYYHRFLGIKTKVLTGTETLIQQYGLTPYYCSVICNNKRPEYYKCKILPIETTSEASSSEPYPITRRYFELLEEDIRRSPSQWLWSHDRWKR